MEQACCGKGLLHHERYHEDTPGKTHRTYYTRYVDKKENVDRVVHHNSMHVPYAWYLYTHEITAASKHLLNIIKPTYC